MTFTDLLDRLGSPLLIPRNHDHFPPASSPQSHSPYNEPAARTTRDPYRPRHTRSTSNKTRIALNMHTQDRCMGLYESPESSSSSPKEKKEKQVEKKKKRRFPMFHSKPRPSSRASEHDPLRDQDKNTIPARAAVFSTNELLYEILSKVPLNHFASLRRVSKTWNSVVDQIGYCVEPARFHAGPFPEYPETIPITFNPFFGRLRQKPTRPSA